MQKRLGLAAFAALALAGSAQASTAVIYSNDFSVDAAFVPASLGFQMLVSEPQHSWPLYRAMPLLFSLAEKNHLVDGDSYWTLAQLERKAGQNANALEHAKTALKRPIALQSDELDKEIHKFISELDRKKP